MNTTEKEMMMIENIAENPYTSSNGDIPDCPDDTECCPDYLDEGPNDLSGEEIRKLIQFLIKKKLARLEDEVIWLTEKGFAIYKNK